MKPDDLLNNRQLVRSKTVIPRQRNRGQPELGKPAFLLNMNVRRLRSVSDPEEKPVTFPS
jgi:hypothetical protein